MERNLKGLKYAGLELRKKAADAENEKKSMSYGYPLLDMSL